ncbi:MAG TPA: hypothetical protein VIV12_13380 [Streptosporangiaceae bacterium]
MVVAWLWLADQAPLDPSSFMPYGVVGTLAVAGLTFGYRAYTQANAERIALQTKLLAAYETVLPALTAATQAVTECTMLLQAIRHDRELEQARQEGKRL